VGKKILLIYRDKKRAKPEPHFEKIFLPYTVRKNRQNRYTQNGFFKTIFKLPFTLRGDNIVYEPIARQQKRTVGG